MSGSGANHTEFAYDLDRALTQVTRPDLAAVAMTYDTAGRLGAINHPHATISLAYESGTGRLGSLQESGGQDLSFGYDAFLPTAETWTGPVAGSVTRTFDNHFRLATESVNGDSAAAYSYDGDGLLTAAGALSLIRDPTNGLLTATVLGDVSTERAYNSFGEPILDRAAAANTTAYEALYVRDALGHITQKTETIEGSSTVWAYTYDAAGRLTKVSKDGVAVSAYTFDPNGNRLSHTSLDGLTLATYDDQDRLLSYGDTTYTYTANGELETKTDAAGTTFYDYDALGNLRRVDLPDGRVIEYVIDGSNGRVGKKVDGVLVQGWLYRDQLEPVAELDGAGNVVARFVYGSRRQSPDYLIKGGVTYRVVTDHLGSPRLIVDASTGAIAQRMDYDEWGNVTQDTASGFQPFGFAGGLWDADTGFVRFGARDYDPEVGRWTAKDSARFGGRATMLYSYCFGDPINFVDPGGKTPVSPELTGFAIRAAAAILSTYDDFARNKEALFEVAEDFEWGQDDWREPDKYYHCMANCESSSRGPLSRAVAECLGNANEWLDQNWSDPPGTIEESQKDQLANKFGREGPLFGSCEGRCSPFLFAMP